MADQNTKPGEPATETTETVAPGQQQESTTETVGQDQQQTTPQETQPTGTDSQQQAPEGDAQKDPKHVALLADLRDERTKRQGLQQEVETLKQQVADANSSTEAMTALQTKYDRLEAFLLSAGGPLGKALDSRTFTRDLFETDKDVAEIAAAWHRDNPSATSQALGGGTGAQGGGKHSVSDLLRIAATGS